MTVLEAMNLLGLSERPKGLATLELAMAQAFEQTPRQHELLEEAGRCLSADLELRMSAQSRLTSAEQHSTREILLFDENRDAVMFGDDAPILPVPFHASPVDDALWMGDDSVIFEGEAEMMSDFAATPALNSDCAAEAAPINEATELPLHLLSSETSISGEWQLMLESLEAEGLIKPEEGFSDALSAQMIALHDTLAERLAAAETDPIFAPLEPHGPESLTQNSALLEKPLFSELLLESPLLATPPTPVHSALEIPLFAAPALDTSEQSKVITFDESLLILHGGSPMDNSGEPSPESHIASTATVPTATVPTATVPVSVAPISAAPKTLETLPRRKASEAAQLSIKPAAAQPSRMLGKQPIGRGSVALHDDVAHTERRTTTKPEAPRTYRDARESPTQVRRRRQPVAVWLLSVVALLGTTVFIAPNLAAQLRNQLLPRATPSKPSGGSVVAKPQVRVVEPAAIRPAQSSLSPAKALKPAGQTPTVKPSTNQPRVVKPSANQSNVSKPNVSKPDLSKPSVIRSPRAAAPVTAPSSNITPTPRAATIVKAATLKTAPIVRATPSSVSSLPPVTRPEGFASAAANKPVSKSVAAVKPTAALVKPALRPSPSPSPAPAPVASIEYQEQPTTTAAAGALPGGLSRQEFGRQFLNRKQFEVWQGQQLTLRFENFAQIPLTTQVLEAEAFRAAVLIPTVRPTRPERP